MYTVIHMYVRFPSETTIPCWDSKASIWTISHLQNMKAHLDTFGSSIFSKLEQTEPI